MGKIPYFVLGEGFILRRHLETLIIRDQHLFSSSLPGSNLVGFYLELARLVGMALDRFGCRAQIMLRHQIGVDIVVSDGTVLVWSGDAIDTKVSCRIVKAERLP